MSRDVYVCVCVCACVRVRVHGHVDGVLSCVPSCVCCVRSLTDSKMLSQNCKDYSQENTMYNKDPDKAGTARMLLSKMIESENTNVYSLEVSMYGYKPDKKTDKVIAYTEENCE